MADSFTTKDGIPIVTQAELRVNMNTPGKEQRDRESAQYISDQVPRKKVD